MDASVGMLTPLRMPDLLRDPLGAGTRRSPPDISFVYE
jgi:hypothetical protein